MHTLALPKSVLSSELGPQRPMAHSELAYLIKKKLSNCEVQIDVRLWQLVVSHTGQPVLYFICHEGPDSVRRPSTYKAHVSLSCKKGKPVTLVLLVLDTNNEGASRAVRTRSALRPGWRRTAVPWDVAQKRS